MIELMIQVFIEVRITYSSHTATHCNTLQHTATHCNTYSSQHNQLPAVLFCLWRLSHLLPSVKDEVCSGSTQFARELGTCNVTQSHKKDMKSKKNIEKNSNWKKLKRNKKTSFFWFHFNSNHQEKFILKKNIFGGWGKKREKVAWKFSCPQNPRVRPPIGLKDRWDWTELN